MPKYLFTRQEAFKVHYSVTADDVVEALRRFDDGKKTQEDQLTEFMAVNAVDEPVELIVEALPEAERGAAAQYLSEHGVPEGVFQIEPWDDVELPEPTEPPRRLCSQYFTGLWGDAHLQAATEGRDYLVIRTIDDEKIFLEVSLEDTEKKLSEIDWDLWCRVRALSPSEALANFDMAHEQYRLSVGDVQ